MATPSELSFDFKPHIYSMMSKSFGEQSSEQTQKLEEFVARLEEERLKIDAFKRELPLCMQLLTNAMEVSRQQLQSQRGNQGATRPVLEEFIPLKNTSPSTQGQFENGSSDKSNWMTSAQLWNQDSEEGTKAMALDQNITASSHQETDINLDLISTKQRMNGGGAFLPFTKERNSSSLAFPELARASSHKDEVEVNNNNNNNNDKILSQEMISGGKCGNSSNIGGEKEQVNNGASTTQTHRKARRCWSPDLHRRFVNALHMLGGSHVATPKQIRELMKVEGLTNDEVKSHLQKYRLHTRRPSPSPQAAVTAAAQVVVLGGIWVPPEYAAAAAAHGGASAAALYGASATHHVPPSFCPAAPPVPQEIYPAIAPPPPPSHHPVHQHQLHAAFNKPQLTQRNGSPESDMRGGGGDPSESIEDEKSESGSWKVDSGGENGGERKRLDGEESNGSVVNLKF